MREREADRFGLQEGTIDFSGEDEICLLGKLYRVKYRHLGCKVT